MAESCRWEDWQQAESLQNLSAIDSVAILDFVLALETEFTLKFPIDDLKMELFTHRAQLVAYLTAKLSGPEC